MNSKTAKDTEVVIIRVKRAHLFCFVANKGQLEKQDWTLDWTGLAEIRSYTVSYGSFYGIAFGVMSRTFSEVVAGSPGSPVEESWVRKFQEEDEAEALEKVFKLSKVRSSIQ